MDRRELFIALVVYFYNIYIRIYSIIINMQGSNNETIRFNAGVTLME